MTRLGWELSFTSAYQALYRGRQWEDRWTTEVYSRNCAKNASAGFSNFIHCVVVAGALMAAEDRGYRSGYRTGYGHGGAYRSGLDAAFIVECKEMGF